jgi:hypothetical protein
MITPPLTPVGIAAATALSAFALVVLVGAVVRLLWWERTRRRAVRFAWRATERREAAFDWRDVPRSGFHWRDGTPARPSPS